jgi:exonuclease SbcC
MQHARSARALSGSQKFRCAVAIASGIGQYAGAGGMRSIVIDEGFGSLDTGSQRQMVDELQQLAQHMDKVIVVSHLDVFSDPVYFPDRLIVERTSEGGSTIRRASG